MSREIKNILSILKKINPDFHITEVDGENFLYEIDNNKNDNLCNIDIFFVLTIEDKKKYRINNIEKFNELNSRFKFKRYNYG